MGRCPKPVQHDSSLHGSEEYCFYHECKGQKIIHYLALRRYLKELIQRWFLKEYVLTLEAIFRQSYTHPPREQNLIAQYKMID